MFGLLKLKVVLGDIIILDYFATWQFYTTLRVNTTLQTTQSKGSIFKVLNYLSALKILISNCLLKGVKVRS